MSEGRYWNCRWERTTRGFRAWVARRPKLSAEGRTWQATLDDPCAKISDASGDGEPNLRFDPPEPANGTDAQWIDRRWVTLEAQGGLPLDTMAPDLFTKGFCPHCGDPRGERTKVSLRATGPADADMCSPWLIGSRYDLVMVSERFLSLWNPSELKGFRLLPVTPAPRSRSRYIEIVPREYIARVAVRAWTLKGARCPVCRRDWFLCTPQVKIDFGSAQVHEWCCTDDLPGRQRGALAFGSLQSWHFLLPVNRARELCRHRFGRGARISALGAVPPELVLRRPRLPPALKRR